MPFHAEEKCEHKYSQEKNAKGTANKKTGIRIPMAFPTQFFTDHERTILNLIWKNKAPRIAKTNLCYKRTVEASLISSCTIEQ